MNVPAKFGEVVKKKKNFKPPPLENVQRKTPANLGGECFYDFWNDNPNFMRLSRDFFLLLGPPLYLEKVHAPAHTPKDKKVSKSIKLSTYQLPGGCHNMHIFAQ